MSKSDLVPVDVLQKAVSSGQVELLSLLNAVQKAVDESHVAAERKRRVTWQSRIDEYKQQMLEDISTALVELQDAVKEFVDVFDMDLLPGNLQPREGVEGLLDQEQINRLSREYALYIKISAALKAIYNRYRALTNEHLNEVYKDSFESTGRPPSQVPGKLVPDHEGTRYEFCREGGNRSNPTIDWDALKERLPREVWLKIVDQKHHPAQVIEAWTEEIPNAKKLEEAIRSGDVELEVLREVLVPGEWQTPRFVVREKRG